MIIDSQRRRHFATIERIEEQIAQAEERYASLRLVQVRRDNATGELRLEERDNVANSYRPQARFIDSVSVASFSQPNNQLRAYSSSAPRDDSLFMSDDNEEESAEMEIADVFRGAEGGAAAAHREWDRSLSLGMQGDDGGDFDGSSYLPSFWTPDYPIRNESLGLGQHSTPIGITRNKTKKNKSQDEGSSNKAKEAKPEPVKDEDLPPTFRWIHLEIVDKPGTSIP